MEEVQPYVYKHAKSESFSSKLVKRYLIAIDRKTSIVRIFETKKFKHVPAPFISSLKKSCRIDEITIDNRPVWTLTPKKNQSDKVIFFSHGGGHINNITSHHWRMLDYIIQKTGAKVIVPDYPLLPNATYKETYEMMEKVFFETVKNIDSKNLIFLGDSAGGAISLALAQILRDKNAPIQPKQLILISPELDASNFHEAIPLYEKNDVMLVGDIFHKVYPHYVADCPKNHFLISPRLGNLKGIGHISVFAGTHDVLFPYAADFKQRLVKENHPFHFYEYPKMMHVWVAVTFMKEAKSALKQIVNLINR